MPALLPHPPLLAHTIYQALAFDDALREAGFSFVGTTQQSQSDPEKGWEGMSDLILGQKDWFHAWILGERSCETISNLSLNQATLIAAKHSC